MSIDLSRSRRSYNEFCRWWKRNESDDYESSVLVNKKVPSGSFFAKEVGSETDDYSALAGVFILDSTSITIKSPDNLTGISPMDIVEYDKMLWRVRTIQVRRIKKQTNKYLRNDNAPHIWFLELSRIQSSVPKA